MGAISATDFPASLDVNVGGVVFGLANQGLSKKGNVYYQGKQDIMVGDDFDAESGLRDLTASVGDVVMSSSTGVHISAPTRRGTKMVGGGNLTVTLTGSTMINGLPYSVRVTATAIGKKQVNVNGVRETRNVVVLSAAAFLQVAPERRTVGTITGNPFA